MADDKTSFVRKPEHLRVPQGWTAQDKALVIQLERILNDIYRLYGNSEKVTVTDVSYDETDKKLVLKVGGTSKDIVSIATIKSGLGSFTWGALAGM